MIKLMLADDSRSIQKLTKLIFSARRYTLSVATEAEQTLVMARELQPDLILVDISLPGMDGYQLCTQLKNDACGSLPRILLLSGAFDPFDEAHARAAAADGWLTKPFEAQLLIDKVEQLLAGEPLPAPGKPVEEPVVIDLNVTQIVAGDDACCSAGLPAVSARVAPDHEDYIVEPMEEIDMEEGFLSADEKAGEAVTVFDLSEADVMPLAAAQIVADDKGEVGTPTMAVAELEKQLIQLSDEELTAVVERVARPAVEKLAVDYLDKNAAALVHELAERLIKDEIAKITS